ncbi:antibiotic biosynthesis monooxygenase family protein [Streptomyces sp. OE57]|uniref:antibiotic biosynthesis monooxygenase family protein n=1 Tax=Streptomyces lacaronensis TaxID=3379885 RepID=UPI0039B7368E
MTIDSTDHTGVTFFEFDPSQDFATQLGLDATGCTLLDIVVAPPGKQEEVVEQWRRHADYMHTQPGLIKVQLHQTVGGGTTIVNLAVWESPAALRAAISTPEFAAIAVDYPPGTVCTRHLVSAVAVPGICAT